MTALDLANAIDDIELTGATHESIVRDRLVEWLDEFDDNYEFEDKEKMAELAADELEISKLTVARLLDEVW